MMNKKIAFLCLCIGIIFSTFARQRPNILLIQVDDLGHDDLRINGNRYIETPAIDQFARESVSFEQFYTHSICAPTRASLLTGRHFLRTGVSGVHGGRDFLNLEEKTIGDILQKNGYKTGIWGKWHSGKTAGYFPWDRGFQEAFMTRLYQYENCEGHLNGKLVKTKQWATEVITDYALNFIEKNQKESFLAYISYMAPHEPWKAPDSYIEKYKRKGLSDRMSVLYGMIEHLDHHIGRVLRRLKELDLEENTVVFFMSDNGPWTTSKAWGKLTEEEWKLRNPNGYRGNKGTNWENGILSPLFIRYGNKYTRKICYRTLSVEDILPTILVQAGIEQKDLELDGKSFVPLLRDTELPWEKELLIAQWNPLFPSITFNKLDRYQHHIPLSKEVRKKIKPENQCIGIRTQRYKLLYNQYGGLSVDNYELRDMYTDSREQKNIYAENPQIAEKLKQKLENYYQSILQSPHAYRMPVFLIGYKNKKESEILGYAPLRISGHLVNAAHLLKGWSKKDDEAVYKIDVRTPGKYRVNLHYRNQDEEAPEMQFELQVGNSKTTIRAKTKDVSNWGILNLEKGENILTVKLLHTPLQAFKGLETIVFEKR